MWPFKKWNEKPKPSEASLLPHWGSSRGDEWWCGKAEGSFNIAINTFTINSFGPSHVGQGRALSLLRAARTQFPEYRLTCFLDASTRPVMELLAEKELVRWTEIKNPHSREALVEAIAEA